MNSSKRRSSHDRRRKPPRRANVALAFFLLLLLPLSAGADLKTGLCREDAACGSDGICLKPLQKASGFSSFFLGGAGAVIADTGTCAPKPAGPVCASDGDCPTGQTCFQPYKGSAFANAAFGAASAVGYCVISPGAAVQPAQPLAPIGPPVEVPLITPRLEIPIPTVKFTPPLLESGVISIPFLAQYVGGVYQFLLGVVGIVAAVMMMVGGFQYLTAGGDGQRVGKAKKRIADALIGMALAFGSYLLLWTLNPDLVEFKALQVAGLQTEIIGGIQDTGTSATDKEAEPLPESYKTGCKSADFDKLFQAYASCVKYGDKVLDWRILKAISCAESGLNPKNYTKPGCSDAKGNCFIGMFQLYKPYCTDGYKSIANTFPNSSSCDESVRENPEFNIALYSKRNAKNLLALLGSCGEDISLKDFLLTLYVGHNNGPGVMAHIIKKPDGCHFTGSTNSYEACKAEKGDASGMRAAVRSFYETKGVTNATSSGKTCSLDRLKKFTPDATNNTKWFGACITADYGEVKMCFGFNIVNYAQSYGATSVLVPSDQQNPCPLDAGKALTQ